MDMADFAAFKIGIGMPILAIDMFLSVFPF